MIPYDMDPSLHTSEPEPPMLDDGFSPPRRGEAGAEPVVDIPATAPGAGPEPGGKSPF
jgi:hypothetical protein